jgi:Bifunctional DNA primase/polymerase, N-terminal
MLVPALNQLPVFACNLDKSALTQHGFYNAVVGADYSRWPRVGVATGAVSGIDVIDIDPDGLQWLDANRHRLPPTREHQTPRGVHLPLQHHPNMRNSNRRIAPGVDVRGDGGYVIWWPREGFPVIDAQLAAWPEWLLALATTVVHSIAHSVEGRMSRSPSHGGGGVEPTANLKLRSSYVLNKVYSAKVGERNRLLFWGSCRHGEMIGEGRIKREVAEKLLEGAAKTNGLWRDGADQVRATIRSGIETGIKQWQAMDKATMQGGTRAHAASYGVEESRDLVWTTRAKT